MFPAAPLGVMKAYAAKLLTETCDIERQQGTSGELMSPDTGWVVVATAIDCRMIRRNLGSSGYAEVGSQDTQEENYRLVLSNDADIQPGDRVVQGSVTYNVVRLTTDLTDSFFKMAILSVRN